MMSDGGREKTGAGHTGPKAKVNDHLKVICASVEDLGQEPHDLIVL